MNDMELKQLTEKTNELYRGASSETVGWACVLIRNENMSGKPGAYFPLDDHAPAACCQEMVQLGFAECKMHQGRMLYRSTEALRTAADHARKLLHDALGMAQK